MCTNCIRAQINLHHPRKKGAGKFCSRVQILKTRSHGQKYTPGVNLQPGCKFAPWCKLRT